MVSGEDARYDEAAAGGVIPGLMQRIAELETENVQMRQWLIAGIKMILAEQPGQISWAETTARRLRGDDNA